MQRYFIYLAYNGKNYSGWQIQPNAPSVQEKLEKILGMLLRTPTPVVGAGRTDAGVHARLMVAHFDTKSPVDINLLTDKLNRILPYDISVYKIVEVVSGAHARFDALRRGYEYHITNEKNPFNTDFVFRYHGEMDFNRMNEACAILYEYIDFTSFSKLHTDVKTNNCIVYRAIWEKSPDNTWIFHIEADRFLRNMVRAIVGTLIEVGRGKLTVDGFREVIEKKDRSAAGTSVPGKALFLTKIEYDPSIFC